MPKRVLTGTVVSDKGDKTIVVNVERKVKHPLYGKIIRRTKNYNAHDANNEYVPGDVVRIEETKPISKTKTWAVIDRVQASKGVEIEADLDVKEAKPTGAPEDKTTHDKPAAEKDEQDDAKADAEA